MEINIGLVFGGCSVEHEISVITAIQAYHNYQGAKYKLIPIYLSKDQIFYTGEALTDLQEYKNLASLLKKCRKVDFYKHKNTTYMKMKTKKIALDAIWPVVHGNHCEDGSLYNYFHMLGFVCISMDHFQGAISQDKILCKQLMQANKIKQIDFFDIHLFQYNQNSDVVFEKAHKIGYPLIVKPARLGSSIGVCICYDDATLIDAIESAFQYDLKVIVEKFIENAKEYNISILGDASHYQVSEIEEVTKSTFLSYEDKYVHHSKSKGMAGLNRLIPANIDKKLRQNMVNTALKVVQILDACLCVRLDFLYDEETKCLYFNEINNIPGSLAFYLWEKTNLSFTDLIEKIIELGIKQEYYKSQLNLTYQCNIFNTSELNQICISK